MRLHFWPSLAAWPSTMRWPGTAGGGGGGEETTTGEATGEEPAKRQKTGSILDTTDEATAEHKAAESAAYMARKNGAEFVPAYTPEQIKHDAERDRYAVTFSIDKKPLPFGSVIIFIDPDGSMKINMSAVPGDALGHQLRDVRIEIARDLGRVGDEELATLDGRRFEAYKSSISSRLLVRAFLVEADVVSTETFFVDLLVDGVLLTGERPQTGRMNRI